MNPETTGIILAGGMARRMGGSCDKAFLKIDNETIVARQLRILGQIFKKIIIVTNSPDNYVDIKEAIVIPDVISHRGPIGGIYSGLLASGSFYNFITACDMPFLNGPVIRYMIENKEGYDAVVPKVDGEYHPLFGVYSRNCVPVIEALIKGEDLRVMNIFAGVRSRFITRSELERFDGSLSTLANINTNADYEALRDKTCLKIR